MSTVTPDFVRELIDFAPTEETKRLGFAESQLEGSVAIFNMLVRNRCAYLADEVGMGKTYVALAVMSLVRYFDPGARIVVIAPRENIQRKWVKELQNFVGRNWKPLGNRVKSLQGEPAWEPILCGSLLEFAREALVNADRDFFLRMTSFSLALKQAENRQRLRRELRRLLPWLSAHDLSAKTPEGFRDAFGCALNAAVPDADLLVIDEGHNLKHGFRAKGSIRNRILGFAFGHPEGASRDRAWYRPRAKRVLMLSATPFEEEYGAIQRQFEILGFGQAKLHDAQGGPPVSLGDLTDSEVPESEKRRIVDRLMVRRVSGLRIAGELWTKNMYRREWRMGGFELHDEPIRIADPKQRLVVGLIQKKVAEILQDERFGNSFQIGMLSSFESFLESAETTRRSRKQQGVDEEETAPEESDESTDEQKFSGEQTATRTERQGIDTSVIAQVVDSYRERFGATLPHPKLDVTARALGGSFETGEKTLVFVRRVATVRELAAKLDAVFDDWIRKRMEAALPHLQADLAQLFALYDRERRIRPDDRFESLPTDHRERDALASLQERRGIDEDDEGSAETFFAWFFRGKGPEKYLSGAAFQKNRLASTSAVYSTLFEDDHVSWLLGRPEDPIAALCRAVGEPAETFLPALRRRAYWHFQQRTRQAEGYPRLYVYECYQVAALEALTQCDGELAERARIVLQERHPALAREGEEQEPPEGFPSAEEGIAITTFFTELVKRPSLREELWPDEEIPDFRTRLRRREQRRELLSGMARLGLAYVDLYCLAMQSMGSFRLSAQAEADRPVANLAQRFVELLERQAGEPGLHAYRELSAASKNFDLVLSVNFPEVPTASLHDLAALYGATLQRQVPIGHMSGGVNKRLVRQFRMPGFPVVLVTTDVLQEGEDLHTFCRRVIHYGISWTPSAMEQRTGRVDRIGSLVQRRLDGCGEVPRASEWLQVHYPHLQDTVEVLQVRRVLRQLNRFLQLITKTAGQVEDRGSRIDAARAVLDELEMIPPVTEPLESAFPIGKAWLDGESTADDVQLPRIDALEAHFDELWNGFLDRYAVEARRDPRPYTYTGAAQLVDSRIAMRGEAPRRLSSKRFRLELRSQASGEETLLRCRSTVGKLDLLRDNEALDHLYDLQRDLGQAKVCVRRSERAREDLVTVEGDILFDPGTTDPGEVETLVSRVVCAAAALRSELELEGDGEEEEAGGRVRRPACAPESRQVDDISEMIDQLISAGARWTRTDGSLMVKLGRSERHQRIELARRGDLCVLRSAVVGPAFVTRNHAHWRRVAYRAWRRNAEKELVAFGFDAQDRLIGVVEQPIASMSLRELRFHVEMLAKECDRFEYVLTGEDEG
ncbi:MAG: hypothetical protein GF330_04535 [Candidatus Eisenbacteria bacterium]|nr:hypothetical protein [Candidatus Eisenbacteria bacterium]